MAGLDHYESGSYDRLMHSGIVGFIWVIIYFIMERPFAGKYFENILEIGAGEGNYLKNLRCNFDSYYSTDLRRLDNSKLKLPEGVFFEQQDASSLKYEVNKFDRSISTCVLPHVDHPKKVLSELHRVTKKDGSITLYVPCEPGILLRLMRFLITSRKFKFYSSNNYYEMCYAEHKHYFLSIDYAIKSEFTHSKITRRFFPFLLPFWNMNLFCIYQIQLSKK